MTRPHHRAEAQALVENRQQNVLLMWRLGGLAIAAGVAKFLLPSLYMV